ncbi:DUF5677 domain-containing protein [Burkholderia pyrrocinia]|uniref:DUF5677 domain-containing protein n=1 Tax=Burkholderia pyrrocinia TaxID=60550 RepID=UPI00158B9B53|nr:DUF5677 domain-containing protein [Burkholderia pyrrocinia]
MIDIQQDAAVISRLDQCTQDIVKRHKEELLSQIKNESQRIIVRYYLNVLRELCEQACRCLMVNAFSTAEVMSRVIIEQSANLLYVAMDSGGNALALLRSSRLLTQNNGKNWITYLNAHGLENTAARARQANGEALLADFDKRWPSVDRYPGSKALFARIGWENQYHAFYAPLCDSVHSFSDDLSNIVEISELFATSAQHGTHMLTYWEKERRRLATYHCAVAVALRSEAIGRICDIVGFAHVLKEIQEAATELQCLVERHEQFDRVRTNHT